MVYPAHLPIEDYEVTFQSAVLVKSKSMYHKRYDFSQLESLKEKIIGETSDHYIGRVLTIIDASFTGDQCKAVKDLIKKEMYEYLQDSFDNSRRLVAHTIRMVEAEWMKEEDGEPLRIVITDKILEKHNN